MTNNELLEEFNSLPNDVEKWKWIKRHQHTGILIYLDNDSTCGVLPDENDPEDPLIFDFDSYVGWADGVECLLEAIGIKAECV